MALFKRVSQATAQREVMPVAESDLTLGVDPHELIALQFVEANRIDLEKSSELWGNTYSTTNFLKSDDFVISMSDGIADYLKDLDYKPLSERQLRATSQNFAGTLGDLCFMTARAHCDVSTLRGAVNGTIVLFGNLPQDVHYAATREGGRKREYLEAVIAMRKDIKSADAIADSVLSKFTSAFETFPESIAALADLYDYGAASLNASFDELKEILRTDWHHPDKESSVLRQFVTRLGQDPDAFLDEFVDTIVYEGEDRKSESVRNMARFALAAAEADDTQEGIRGILIRTRHKWNHFDDIDKLYAQFKQRKLLSLVSNLDRISGPSIQSNPRLKRTTEDIENYKRTLWEVLNVNENRQDRRRRRAEDSRRPLKIPTRIEIIQPDQERYSREGKPIYFAKSNGSRSLVAEQIAEDGLEEFVASRVHGHLVEDIVACIKKINENPMAKSSRFLVDGRANVKVSGRAVRLRRFKPRLADNLHISNEAESWRICFGIDKDGSVIITDILSHDKFDKKY